MRFLLIDKDFNYDSLSDELKKVYNNYIKACSKKTEFEKILIFKKTNVFLYNEKCKQLASSIKYISYRSDRKVFEVKPRYNGKLIWLGSTNSFNEACNMLKEYISIKQQEL